ncbi:hypothetical protein AMTRI_Chr04g249280 [Amborella trichopoda]
MLKTIVCDRDLVFTSTFWKDLFCLQDTDFKLSYAYHPQTDSQTEVVNRTVEMYLCIHTSTKKAPYKVVYGRSPLTLLSYVPGALYLGSAYQRIKLNNQLQTAQKRMKKFYDAHWTDRSFEVGEFVYLCLQMHRQVSVALRKNLKLSPRYYGPESSIHPVFHISYLKKKVGSTVQVQHELPNVQEENDVVLAWPQAVLDQRTRKRREEILIHWQGLYPLNTNQEDLEQMKTRFPESTLEDKGDVEGGMLCVC